MFKEVSPDLIVTDILMPEKEGIETIREIRQESSEVKIIALSGGGTHPTGLDYLQMALELGANLSFPQPFKISEFRTAVAELTSTLTLSSKQEKAHNKHRCGLFLFLI